MTRDGTQDGNWIIISLRKKQGCSSPPSMIAIMRGEIRPLAVLGESLNNIRSTVTYSLVVWNMTCFGWCCLLNIVSTWVLDGGTEELSWFMNPTSNWRDIEHRSPTLPITVDQAQAPKSWDSILITTGMAQGECSRIFYWNQWMGDSDESTFLLNLAL